MESMKKKLDEFANICRSNGYKLTPQRQAVYKYLLQTTEHPSAEAVCRALREEYPGISLDTVNRTLLFLDEIGVAFVVEGTGDVRRFDAGMTKHQHFKCLKCRKIFDFSHEPFNEIETPEDFPEGFAILRKTVSFEGYCEECNEETDC
jgi:Fur family peroxide stress response transcriptional regulator